MPEDLPDAVRAARKDVGRLLDERASLLRKSSRERVVDTDRLLELDERIAELLDRAAALVDPCDASPDVPLVLLPVRLETRFGKDGRRDVLRVRIYPDDVHVDSLARGLTEQEETAGRAYWVRVWSDADPDESWPLLVTAVGAARAEWVAHATRPTNLAERGSGEPAFGAVPRREVRSTVARALPDRFVVLAVQGEQVSQAVGRPVPPDLAASPVPLEGDSAVEAADALSVPQGAEWLVDYDRAVQVGMAVTVPLSGGRRRVDRVLAVGTRGSLPPRAGADELEDLLRGHRFARGLGLLEQGTPTNNTDSGRSPYRSGAEPVAPALVPSQPRPDSDTSAAARLLGVDPATLTDLVGDGHDEQAVARNTNTALWAPGWGGFLSRLDVRGVEGVDDAQRESARQLFRDHVRGRGPAPALRVGAQPYGVLPVSDLARWKPRAGETTAGIVEVVRRLLTRWDHAARSSVPRVRPGEGDAAETLLEVLGSSPVMQSLRVRPVLDDDVSDAVRAAIGHDQELLRAEHLLSASVVAGVLGAQDAAKVPIGSLHRRTRPLPLPLASARDGEFIAALLGRPSKVLAVDSVLQALLALAWSSTELDVRKAAPATVLPDVVGMAGLEPHLKADITALLGRADDAEPDEVLAVADRVRAAGVAPAGASLLLRYEPVEHVQTSLAEVALAFPVTEASKELASGALLAWLSALGYRGEVRQAAQALAGTTVEARRLAVAESLDCSSHRLDAWATAVVDERASRNAQRGCTIGAYGVALDVEPGDRAAGGGWIHAPSTQHATAAGMLRSAHLSHLATDGTGAGPFDIDLSSTRVRAAEHVLAGVRRGQSVGALLGYAIERGLAEERLQRFTLVLRTLAPLRANRLHQPQRGAVDHLAATDVVDGCLLLERFPPGDDRLWQHFATPPDNPYLRPSDWKPPTPGQKKAITAVLRRAAETLDAVADVLLSESVLQYAGGSAARAAAAMDAMSSGARPVDELGVLDTQDPSERLTHRVIGVVGQGSGSGWTTSRPRAQAEPSLEAWAAAHLGDPADVVLAGRGGDRITLDDAGFCALDLVHARDAATVERVLRHTVPALAEADLATVRDPDWPRAARTLGELLSLATSLRQVLAGATPLLPEDLTPPSVTAERDLSAALPELVARVTALAGSLRAAVEASQAAVEALPDSAIAPDEATARTVVSAVLALEPFGVPLEPVAERPLDLAWAVAAWESAEARSVGAKALAQRLANLPADTPPMRVLDAAQEVADAVLGDGFLVVPVLPAPPGPDALSSALQRPAFPAPAATAVRQWIRDHATVRPHVRRWSELLLVGGALGRRIEPEVAQLALADGDAAAPGTTLWLAGPLPAGEPWPDTPVAHLVLDRVGDVQAGKPVAGLVLDAWVEALPAQVGPSERPDLQRPGRGRTGLAVHAESASARPPQTVLCAVSPDGRRWTTDTLRGVVEQALQLAQVRLVTLERLAGDAAVLPALYARSSSLQGEPHLDLTALAAVSTQFVAAPFVREPTP